MAAGASKSKELTHLLHAISACFQASGHRTPVLFALGGRVAAIALAPDELYKLCSRFGEGPSLF